MSGAAALVVETTWLRWFQLLFGATAPAASATLVAFFAGQALGAAWGARRAPHWRSPLRAYGLLELAAAAGAVAAPALLAAGDALTRAAYEPLRQQPSLLAAVRFGVALAATLPAAMAFGATLPAVGSAAVQHTARLGSRGSALYAWNTAGAATGAALSAFVLPDLFGVRAGYALGVAASLGVGVAALMLARGADAPAPPPPKRPSTSPNAGWAVAGSFAAVSGFAALAAQVLLVHAFAQILNQSVYAFGSVLVVVLAALAAGAGLVSRLEAGGRVPAERVLGFALAAGSVAWLLFPVVFYAASDGLSYVGTALPWPGYLLLALALVAATAGVPLVLGALVLPATFALAGRASIDGHPGSLLGRLAAANTLGAIAGALAAPWLLLPLFGLFGAFAALAALLALCALLAPGRSDAPLRAGLVTVGALAVLTLGRPLDRPAIRLEPGERLVASETTSAGLVAVVQRHDGLLIRTDNHYVLGGTAEQLHEERQGHLPLILHPAPQRAAFVGTATAITAGAATAHPLERLHLVEIVPAVSRAAASHFAAANRRVHDDPRSVVVLDDARNFLRATAERFDVVVADLFVPWRSGTGALYTREHFAAVRERLQPRGLFCQWLPLYQLDRVEFEMVARTFLDVFPETALFRGDFYGRYPIAALVGFTGRPASAADISASAVRLGRAGESDRWVTDPLGPWSLYVGALGPLRETLAAQALNTDDRPRIQYRAARGHGGGGAAGRHDPFVGEAFARFAEQVRLADAAAGHPLFPDLSRDAARASQGGSYLQLAGALYAQGRQDETGRALAAAAQRLPAHLFRNAPADPSAAEVWHALDPQPPMQGTYGTVP
jgi:spermidine synthase